MIAWRQWTLREFLPMRFTVLDAWRGLAALAVALSRFGTEGAIYASPLVTYSYLFVDFFFVLSGFVIAHAYLEKVQDAASLTTFAIRRFGRLWPLHAAMFVLFLLYEAARTLMPGAADGSAPFTGLRAASTILPELGFLSALGFGPTGWNHPSWSISAEFWTYLLFAAICLSFRANFAKGALLVAAVSMAIVVSVSHSGMDVTFAYGIFRCIAGFFVGGVTYLAFIRWSARWTASAGRSTWIETVCVCLAIAFVWFAGRGPVSFAAPLVFAGLVFIFAHERGAVSRLLKGRAPQFLGELSYSIYMVALFVAMVAQKAITIVDGRVGGGHSTSTSEGVFILQLPGPWLNDAATLVYAASVVVFSVITFRLIEAPGRRFFNRLSERRAQAIASPTPLTGITAGE
ncbi:MAG: acyltransferase 3 [Hyphomicrobiales bacterium]|nr:acyltransferase 3 [Hyphomicrobiales bacterium]